MECPNCGGSPMGEGCYHICHNSVHYYSPEQERHDDQFYGDDDMRERYAATAEPSQYWDEDETGEIIEVDEHETALVDYGRTSFPPLSDDPDDIPF